MTDIVKKLISAFDIVNLLLIYISERFLKFPMLNFIHLLDKIFTFRNNKWIFHNLH